MINWLALGIDVLLFTVIGAFTGFMATLTVRLFTNSWKRRKSFLWDLRVALIITVPIGVIVGVIFGLTGP